MTDRAVGYERLSQGGKSIPEQQEEIEAYAEELGLELVRHYNDGQYSSGYDASRNEYQELLERVQEDDVGHVIVRDRSRLSRDSKERLRLFLELDALGVEVHVAGTSETVDLEDPYSLTRESAQADADDVEKRKEAERGRAEAERREELDLPNGPAPTGLEYGPDKESFRPDHQYADVLEVLERRMDGESWRSIASEVEVSKSTARRSWDRRGDLLNAGARSDDLPDDVRERVEALRRRHVSRATDA
jgi:DNA invertase Pin-like site-specific DNA recombinase